MTKVHLKIGHAKGGRRGIPVVGSWYSCGPRGWSWYSSGPRGGSSLYSCHVGDSVPSDDAQI